MTSLGNAMEWDDKTGMAGGLSQKGEIHMFPLRDMKKISSTSQQNTHLNRFICTPPTKCLR